MSRFAPAGIVASVLAMIYLVLTIGTIAYYRNRIEPTISLGVIRARVRANVGDLEPVVAQNRLCLDSSSGCDGGVGILV